MKNKLLSTLGICRKAGKLVWGFDAVAQAVTGNKAVLVLAAQDTSAKSVKEIRFICDKHNIKVLPIPVTMEDLWQKIGKKVRILAVTDDGLSHTIQSVLSRINEEE